MKPSLAALLLAASAAPAADEPKPNTLTKEQVADGWLLLFDGETTFGWTAEGDAKVKDGELVVGGTKDAEVVCATPFGPCELAFEFRPAGEAVTLRHLWPELRLTGTDKGWSAMAVTVGTGGEVSVVSRAGKKESADLVDRKVESVAPKPIAFRAKEGSTLALRNVRVRPLGVKPLFNGKDLAGWKALPRRSTSRSSRSPRTAS